MADPGGVAFPPLNLSAGPAVSGGPTSSGGLGTGDFTNRAQGGAMASWVALGLALAALGGGAWLILRR